MKMAKCISIAMGASNPALSLLSYWTGLLIAASLRDSYDTWLMIRCGAIPEPALPTIPPSDSVTDEMIFIGDPREGVEFAARMKFDGLKTSLFVLGVDSTSLPVSPGMFAGLEVVQAYPETAAWLRKQGVTVEEVNPLAMAIDVKKCKSPDDATLHVMLMSAPIAPQLLNVPKTLAIELDVQSVWSASGQEINSPIKVEKSLSKADVCVLAHDFLDDAVRVSARSIGVPCVPLNPISSVINRVIEAARFRRDGVFDPIEAKPRSEDDTREIMLGIVVPFGGLATKDLEAALESISRTKPKNSCVSVGHFEVLGKSSETEFDEVEALCQKHKATHVHEKSNVWRMGSARNLGALGLDSGVTHVMFIDADIAVSRKFFSTVLDEIGKGRDRVLVPYVREGETSRIGSGLAIYPYAPFSRIGGFSDKFEGHGFEDLEMLQRVRAKEGIPSVLIGSPIGDIVEHKHHSPRWSGTSLKNFALYNDK